MYHNHIHICVFRRHHWHHHHHSQRRQAENKMCKNYLQFFEVKNWILFTLEIKNFNCVLRQTEVASAESQHIDACDKCRCENAPFRHADISPTEIPWLARINKKFKINPIGHDQQNRFTCGGGGGMASQCWIKCTDSRDEKNILISYFLAANECDGLTAL